MSTIKSALERPQRGLPRQRGGDARAPSTTCGESWPTSPAAARRRPAPAISPAASCWRATASTRCSTPARRSSKCRSWPPTACMAATCRRPGSSLASAGSPAGVHDRRQRRHRQGRHLLPDDGQEAPARAGDRRDNRLPCIYLVDSGGAFLPLQDEVFPDRDHFGRIFYNQAQMSAQGIPQIAVVMGSCTAGGAYVPAMTDETIIVKNQGTIFLGGPPLVKAATGEEVTRRGARRRGRAYAPVRRRRPFRRERQPRARRWPGSIVAQPQPAQADAGERARRREEPLYDPAELYGVVPADTRKPYDVREVIARLVDGCRFHEFKARYGTTLVMRLRAHLRLSGGHPRQQRRAVLGERAQGRALHRAVQPARHPAGVPAEHHRLHGGPASTRARGIAKDGAKMVTAVASASVPKFTVIIGGSFGAGNYGMCGRAYSPRFLWMWPNARISVMGGEQAASVLATVRRDGLRGEGRGTGRPRTTRPSRPRSASSTRRKGIPTTPPPGCGTTA